MQRPAARPVAATAGTLVAAQGWFRKGPEWQKAHGLCQMQEGDRAHDLVHALAHWIEGDEANAAYWYRRVGGGRAPTIVAEWQRISTELQG